MCANDTPARLKRNRYPEVAKTLTAVLIVTVMFPKTYLTLALSLLTIAPLTAQVDRATLTGVVRDSSNAVIPTASVTVTNIATGVAQTSAVTDQGIFLIVNLAPGQYLVEATANGFQKFAQVVLLETGQRGRLDLTLPVGAVGETVTVTGVSPLLDTQTAVLGNVVSQDEVANLPLAIRNWDDLLFTLPGVQGDRYTEQTGTTNAGRTGGVSIHGNRSLQNNFLLDGVDSCDGTSSTCSIARTSAIRTAMNRTSPTRERPRSRRLPAIPG